MATAAAAAATSCLTTKHSLRAHAWLMLMAVVTAWHSCSHIGKDKKRGSGTTIRKTKDKKRGSGTTSRKTHNTKKIGTAMAKKIGTANGHGQTRRATTMNGEKKATAMDGEQNNARRGGTANGHGQTCRATTMAAG